MAPTTGQFATTRGALARLHKRMPAGAARVLRTLRRADAAAYLVGGAVRDAFLDRSIPDWDVATDLEPGGVAALFRRVVLSGVEHGTVMVLTRTGPVEVTTFRGEGPYLDGRRPSHVVFHSDLHADLARRDFTINAMAADLEAGRILDPFGGEKDLHRRCIRCVGDAGARFAEDGLRPLRALRFAASLGFRLGRATRVALAGAVETFEQVAIERKRDELEKLLGRGRGLRSVLTLLESSGMLARLAPELGGTPARVLGRLELLPHDAYLRIAAWGLGAGLVSEEVRGVVGRWKGSRRDQKRVAATVAAAARLPARASAHQLRTWVSEFGPDAAADAVLVAGALWPRRFGDARARLRRTVRAKPPLTVADLVVDGNDLAALGLSGKRIGSALDTLLAVVLERPGKNQKSVLLDLAHRLSTASERDMDPDR